LFCTNTAYLKKIIMFDWTCPGHRCKDSPRVVSLGEASAGDFVDVDTGLPYILVTKYSQV